MDHYGGKLRLFRVGRAVSFLGIHKSDFWYSVDGFRSILGLSIGASFLLSSSGDML
jgi:hypothetical protein